MVKQMGCKHLGKTHLSEHKDQEIGYKFAWIYHYCSDCQRPMARYLISYPEFQLIMDLKYKANVLLDKLPQDVKSIRTESVSSVEGWRFIKYVNMSRLCKILLRFKILY